MIEAIATWLRGHAEQDLRDPTLEWANDVIYDIMDEESVRSWQVLLGLLSDAETRWQVGSIGSGPLEDLLASSEKRAYFMGLVEDEVRSNLNLQRALHFVWLTSDAELERRLTILKEQYP